MSQNDAALDPSERLLRQFTVPIEEERRMTPNERLQRAHELQEQFWTALQADPVAYDAFIRRNFRKRAIDWRDPSWPPNSTPATSPLPDWIKAGLLPRVKESGK